MHLPLHRLALATLLFCSPFAAQAQVSLTGGTYSQNFDTLASTGTSSSLPAGWLVNETGANANGTYTAGTGSSNSGDSYSFGAAGSTERALGGLRSGSLVPTFGACFVNSTGAALSQFAIAYTGEQWRLGTAGRTDRLDFQYSLNATSLTTGVWVDVDALDFTTPNTATVGAKDGNAVGNNAPVSSTVTGITIANGSTFCIRWNDFDAAGADDGLAIDDFSITVGGVALPTLSINDVSQLEGNSGTTDFVFTVSLSSPAPAGGVSVNYATSSDSATAGSDFATTSGTLNFAAGQTSATLTVSVYGDTDLEIDETFLVTLSNPTGASIAGSGVGTGTILNDDIVITSIGVIQGNGELSPFDGQLKMTEGVVTAKRSNGFFLQSFGNGAAAADGDPATSDGIFVFTSAAPAMVAVGDHARVTGTVKEFAGSSATPTTELVSPSVTVLSSGNALPAAVEITAAMAGPGSEPATLERLEGMRVSVAQAVVSAQTDGNISSEANATASDSNSAFEFVVAGVPRPMREPGISILDPFPIPPAKQATIPYFDANQERIKAFPLQGTRLVADAGAPVSNLVGVLTYFGDSWELLYDLANPPVIGAATATAVNDAGANDITVAGFNLQRFFDTTNDPTIGEPVLTATAFANRLAKTGAAICDWVKTPDILGVVEVENIGTLTALSDYVNANCARAPEYVPYLEEGNDVGGIDVGFLVSSRAVRAGMARVQVSSVTQLDKTTQYGTSPLGCTPGSVGCTSSNLYDRPPLALRSNVRFSDGRNYPLTVIVNHLRSLGGNDDPVNGRVRYKRAEQAVELARLVNDMQVANPAEKIVLVGDFNAFPFNDGYVDVMGIITGHPAPESEVIEYRPSPLLAPMVLGDALTADPAQRYSYVFGGNAQTLDHAVVNQALINDPAVTGLNVEHARINSNFRVAHYGEFNPPYTASNPPLRVSDHDPVRLSIGVARPASADLSQAWTSRGMSAKGAFTSLTLRNNGGSDINGVQVWIDLDIPVASNAGVGAPSGWACDRMSHSEFVCTSTQAVRSGSVHTFNVTVKPQRLFLPTDVLHFSARSTVLTDPISGDNTAVMTLP
ncbi:MAG: endonuclease/exonuclease/phosphatase family protein [Xanthomonadaceae bacterium]|nr:endonuclease/exonuclease/phosphatase family protein [Xanthomonadaceae bacterium]